MNNYVIAALYQFVLLEDYEALQPKILKTCKDLGIKGTLLLAKEGINGTIAGTREAIDQLKSFLASDGRFNHLEYKESFHSEQPFYRMKVKLKKEIVTLGVKGLDPNTAVGEYISPEAWNDLIQDPDVIVVDTRNDYEVDIGTFKGAVDPKTHTFREFPDYVEKNLKDKDKKIAMFCTGGIRCEKSTAFMLQQGFKKVYHLKGGILNYLEKIPKEKSLWEGDCFVFDERVSVNHDLVKGDFNQCYGCRHPISEEEMNSPHYIKGVSCPHCYDKTSLEDKSRFMERQKQVTLAKSRNETHIGE